MEQKEKPVLELNARESSALINLVSTDLFKSLVPEDEEENPGAFVHFNLDNDDDSDNRDGAPRHPGADYIANETHGPVIGEDDLKRAKVIFGRRLGRLPNEGKVVLRVTLISGSRHMRVWKSPEKGGGNDVLVTVHEKGWDLSDSIQRQAFVQIKENLWVEGMEYNSVCFLEVEYKKQVNGKWQVVASDKVKYTFIAADCGNQPRTDMCQLPYIVCVDVNSSGQPIFAQIGNVIDPDQRWRWKNNTRLELVFLNGTRTWIDWRGFPNLKDCEFSILDNRFTKEYNCIAYSVDETGPWWYNSVHSIPRSNIRGIDEEYGDNDGNWDWDEKTLSIQT